MSPSNIFTIGTLVEVDSQKNGYIINREGADTSGEFFTIRYSDGDIECEVERHRCRPVSMRRSTTTRSGRVRQAILIPQAQDPPAFEDEAPNTPPIASPPQPPPPPPIAQAADISISFDHVKKAMKNSQFWEENSLTGGQESDHELFALLKRGKDLRKDG